MEFDEPTEAEIDVAGASGRAEIGAGWRAEAFGWSPEAPARQVVGAWATLHDGRVFNSSTSNPAVRL
jgi:hypothetical protein